jgi:cell division protein FtsW (lipid II flippase)
LDKVVDRRERRLLDLAAAFLVLYAIILTLSPAVRENAWRVSYRWSHWIGLAVWAAVVFGAERLISRAAPNRDPYLLPLSALLAGWGVLTIWRLDPGFGLRQAVWLAASMATAAIIVHRFADLAFLRRYKYLLLGFGLTVTGLTLVFGTNPAGLGPRLWLGCCGLYLQPSEPLRLLLVVYLAAYLADRAPLRPRLFPMLAPTLLLTGLAIVILLVQRDLGTACIFILLYTTVLYLATGKHRVLLATASALMLAGLTGFFFVDVVHARLESWINPWPDPSGQSYQIIQSLLAVANGGVLGRGPGLGSPGLVPVAHSDFIFSAVAEETGLVGTIGMLAICGMLLARGLLIALRTSDNFRRLLAAGLAAYLGIQTLVIIGGNLRMLPLTGVTLPFVSYGGSSLLTSYVAVTLLLTISNHSNWEPAPLSAAKPYAFLAAFLGIGILLAAITQGWWTLVRGADLLTRTDNPRRAIADRYVPRGSLLDRNGKPINITVGTSGSLSRVYVYPELGATTGYTHPAYGQAGLEASLDDYLRGLQGNPALAVMWSQLLYGNPPAGLDVRLSIDLRLQTQADNLIGTLKGAAVLLDARSGEILVMASHPTYNPNELDTLGAALSKDRNAPLLNRAAQGTYSPGAATHPFLAASGADMGQFDAARLYRQLGFYARPQVRLPVASPSPDGSVQDLRISPLQMTLAAAALSSSGGEPAPRIALAVDTPQGGWIVLPALGDRSSVFSPESADQTASGLAQAGHLYWEWISTAGTDSQPLTWYIGGTLPHWQGAPLALGIVLEAWNIPAARQIGDRLLEEALGP